MVHTHCVEGGKEIVRYWIELPCLSWLKMGRITRHTEFKKDCVSGVEGIWKKIYTPYLFLFELGVWVSEDATVCFVEWWTSSSVNNMLMFSWEGKQLANHFLWPGRIEKTPLDVDQETPVVLLIINGEDYTRIFCHFFFTVSYRDPSCFLTVSLCRLRSFLPSWDWASA